jgi:hypothetical protein
MSLISFGTFLVFNVCRSNDIVIPSAFRFKPYGLFKYIIHVRKCEYFRYMDGLLGWGITQSQGLCLNREIQTRKEINFLSWIRTHAPIVLAVQDSM